MIADPHELARLRFTPGQDLLSRDFREQAAGDEQLRAWHNRAMHGAYGVRHGLQVTPVVTAGEPTFEVAAGLAYDGAGHELILPAPRRLRVPAGAPATQPLLLVIRRREEGAGAHPAELAAVCLGRPPARGADLAWVPEGALRPLHAVPLARVRGGDAEPLETGFSPPAARPLARPRLGHGSTILGGTPWETWELGGRRLVLGLQIWINTRAAGFTELPCYFAWLQGGIPVSFGETAFFLPLSPHLAEERLNAFRLRVLAFQIGGANDTSLLSLARRHLSLCWLGLQMRDHADPPSGGIA